MASSAILVLAGCMLAKYLTSLSSSIWSTIIVCSTASWCELAEFRKYSVRENAQDLQEKMTADTSTQTSAHYHEVQNLRRQCTCIVKLEYLSRHTIHTSEYTYEFTLKKNHSMFQSTIALTVLLQYRISMLLQYKIKRDRLHYQRGRQNLQETQECAAICDGGKVSETHGPCHSISLASLPNNYQTIKLR